MWHQSPFREPGHEITREDKRDCSLQNTQAVSLHRLRLLEEPIHGYVVIHEKWEYQPLVYIACGHEMDAENVYTQKKYRRK